MNHFNVYWLDLTFLTYTRSWEITSAYAFQVAWAFCLLLFERQWRLEGCRCCWNLWSRIGSPLSVSSTFTAARLCLLPRTQTLICQRTKDKLPQISTSMCLYNFTCSCGAVYLGKTTRRLSKRISEHCPASLRKGTVKNISSAILGHLVDTNHQIDVKAAFKVYYHLPSKYSKGVRKRLLSTAEAIAIRIINPDLCKQKKFIQTLLLPWPS